MNPRTADPFKPAPEVAYSNGEVNRAGQLLRRFYAQPPELFDPKSDGDPFVDFEFDDFVDAMVKITWWRRSGSPLRETHLLAAVAAGVEPPLVAAPIRMAVKAKATAAQYGTLTAACPCYVSLASTTGAASRATTRSR